MPIHYSVRNIALRGHMAGMRCLVFALAGASNLAMAAEPQPSSISSMPPASPIASASQSTLPGALSMHLGFGDRYQRATLNWETPPLWRYRFNGSGGRLDLTGELGVSYWWSRGSRQSDSAWQASAIPMLRWWATERFYLEGGIGVTAFNGTRFAGKNISTAFQFGDHVGFGYQLTRSDRIGFRYSHFSNAGIKRPNPGLDVFQLTYARSF